MTRGDEERESLIDRIIDKELNMFLRVRASEPSRCQDHPEAFKMMRWMTHSALTKSTLLSYLDDLAEAEKCDRNLLTEKYARIEGKISSETEDPLIQEIVHIEEGWARELAHKYPLTIKGGGASFKRYLTSELETYSERTVGLYHELVTRAVREQRNLAEERYDNLFRRLGQGSIQERERSAQSRVS